MIKHTPGPWKKGVPGRGRFCVYARHNGRGICVMSNTQSTVPDHELNLEADANATLIALAPELKDTLKAAMTMIEWLAYEVGRQDSILTSEGYKSALALISEIDGE